MLFFKLIVLKTRLKFVIKIFNILGNSSLPFDITAVSL